MSLVCASMLSVAINFVLNDVFMILSYHYIMSTEQKTSLNCEILCSER